MASCFEDGFDAFPQAVGKESYFLPHFKHFGDLVDHRSTVEGKEEESNTVHLVQEAPLSTDNPIQNQAPNNVLTEKPTVNVRTPTKTRTKPTKNNMLVHVITVTNIRHDLLLPLDSTVEYFLELVENELGIPASQQVNLLAWLTNSMQILLKNRKDILDGVEDLDTPLEDCGLCNGTLTRDANNHSEGSIIHLLVDMQGGRKWRRRKFYTTPKKIKRQTKDHAHNFDQFLNSWSISDESAERICRTGGSDSQSFW